MIFNSLPMNTEGFMRSSTKQSALYAIMTADEYSGDLNGIISRFVLKNSNTFLDYFGNSEKFKYQLKNIELEVDDKFEELNFFSHPYEENKYAYLYKNVTTDTECSSVEIKVEYIQNSDAWSNIGIVFSEGGINYNGISRAVSFQNECSLKITAQGKLIFYLSERQEELRIPDFDIHKTISLRLEIKPRIVAQYSFDDINWNTIYEVENDDLKFKEVGILVNPKINSFYYDFFICNSQLYYNKRNHEIATYPNLEHDGRYFSNMLDERSIPNELITFVDDELIKFFTKLIDMNYYIYLNLKSELSNKNDIKKRIITTTNIIYGYDKKKKVFKRMLFKDKIEFSEIGFREFLNEYNIQYDRNEIVTLYKYKSWKISNSFNLEMLLKILHAYVEGKSSFSVTARKEILYFNEESFVYGINVLNYIVNDENCIKEFIKDDRQLNQIKEHYLVILEMLTFMSIIKVVSYDEYVDLTTRFEELKRACEYIRNLLEECSMSLTREKRDLLRELLLQLADEDKQVTRILINVLSKKS